jgi:hypothetical protein
MTVPVGYIYIYIIKIPFTSMTSTSLVGEILLPPKRKAEISPLKALVRSHPWVSERLDSVRCSKLSDAWDDRGRFYNWGEI